MQHREESTSERDEEDEDGEEGDFVGFQFQFILPNFGGGIPSEDEVGDGGGGGRILRILRFQEQGQTLFQAPDGTGLLPSPANNQSSSRRRRPLRQTRARVERNQVCYFILILPHY
jgi:hypothetical protein